MKTKRWPAAVLGVLAYALMLHWGSHHEHARLAYVGPGAGFAFLGSFLTIALSLAASLFSLLLWPFRVCWRTLRTRRMLGKAAVRKAVLIGLDGLDPKLAERWMDEGKLPNLRRLRESGYYSRLRTTFPALSPVAWSTFATGVNPAKHNIFDFINRDLRTYAPELSSAKVHSRTRFFNIGPWKIRRTKALVEMRRKSEPFWNILGRYAIPSTILRVPATFPPEPFGGKLLSAMCTPDLRGTQGTFSWFTTGAVEKTCEGGVVSRLQQTGEILRGDLQGPEGCLLRFTLNVDSSKKQCCLEIDGQIIALRLGEYSPWLRLKFRLGSGASARGIVRFLLTAAQPEVWLYATPVEIDPENPALPISHPKHYAVYLAKLMGSFATLGLAEDTWGLNEGAIDEHAFLKQARLIQSEREAMFFNALDHTTRGVVACVFDITDRVQHMFFRQMQAGEGSTDSPFGTVIEDLYRDMDDLVGRALKSLDENTAVFVLSDHGFTDFRRGVNLNSWLHQNGYLRLKDGHCGGEYLEGIDWSQTRAYCFGLAGLYLNVAGREAEGTVQRDQVAALRAELAQQLRGLRDPETGEVAIVNVYDSGTIYRGPYMDAAPDLIPGYAPGYRTAWSAATGQVTGHVFEENDKRWSGDHCVDPHAVPGVLFANRPLSAVDPGIEDLAPTVLNLFGIATPKWMEGRSLLNGGNERLSCAA